jgi:glutathione S-transferase
VSYEQVPALAERGKRRAAVFFDKLETRLGESEFIAGDRYTYADIVGYVYLGFAGRALGGATPLEGRPALKQWHDKIAARPAIRGSA